MAARVVRRGEALVIAAGACQWHGGTERSAADRAQSGGHGVGGLVEERLRGLLPAAPRKCDGTTTREELKGLHRGVSFRPAAVRRPVRRSLPDATRRRITGQGEGNRRHLFQCWDLHRAAAVEEKLKRAGKKAKAA